MDKLISNLTAVKTGGVWVVSMQSLFSHLIYSAADKSLAQAVQLATEEFNEEVQYMTAEVFAEDMAMPEWRH